MCSKASFLHIQMYVYHPMNREEAVEELKRIFDVLVGDIEAIVNVDNFSANESAHRSLIRTHFAFMEGMLYQLRRVALATAYEHPNFFSFEEISILLEKNFRLNEKGEISDIKSPGRFLPSMLFSFTTYAKLHGLSFRANKDGEGWAAMRKYVEIRNQLVHPKGMDDLDIDSEKIRISDTAAMWFKETLLKLLSECADADLKYIENST